MKKLVAMNGTKMASASSELRVMRRKMAYTPSWASPLAVAMTTVSRPSELPASAMVRAATYGQSWLYCA